MPSLSYFDHKQADPILKEVLQTVHEAVVCESKDGRIAAVNGRFLELAGHPTPWHGGTLDQLIMDWRNRVTHPQVIEAYFQACRSDGPPEGPRELQPNPGELVVARFSTIRGADGSTLRLWIFHEWKNSALAWVSHEIKNPLNAVLGFTELLLEAQTTETPSPTVKAHLRGLKVGAKHLQAVLGDLLDLSRLESGAVEPRLQWILLSEFLEDIDDLYRTRFERRGLEFRTEGPGDPNLEILTDPGRLTQIVSNLLSNALRFTKRGSVTIRATQRGDHWEIQVEDTGVGIPTDQQQSIFEPFVQKQGQDSHRFGGTGLGLAICRTLAQSLGGSLALASTPGSGSRFSLVFASLETRLAAAPVTTEPVQAAPAPGRTILVADDEKTNHLLIQGFLRGAGYRILSAADGLTAVEQWSIHHPDVVLMDMRMPGLPGTEAARHIRTLNPTATTRILAMSATRPDTRELFDGAPLWDGFLEKPFTKNALLKFLSDALNTVNKC